MTWNLWSYFLCLLSAGIAVAHQHSQLRYTFDTAWGKLTYATVRVLTQIRVKLSWKLVGWKRSPRVWVSLEKTSHGVLRGVWGTCALEEETPGNLVFLESKLRNSTQVALIICAKCCQELRLRCDSESMAAKLSSPSPYWNTGTGKHKMSLKYSGYCVDDGGWWIRIYQSPFKKKVNIRTEMLI